VRITDKYYKLLGLTLLGLVTGEACAGRWFMHTGQLYPYRHVPLFPLYSTGGLAAEWATQTAAAVALWLGVRRPAAVWIAAAAVFATLTQRYSNHTTLIFIVLVLTGLEPPLTDADLAKPNVRLVRWQLAIVYVFSGLSKVLAGFLGGESLSNLYLVLRDPLIPHEWLGPLFRPPAVVGLSAAVVGFELLAPLILWWRPWAGIVLVGLFHAGITILMPAILPFGLIMLAMSVLYVPIAPVSQSRAAHGSARAEREAVA
jgi:hypothetical protein